MLNRQTSEFLLKRQRKEILENFPRIAVLGVRIEPFYKSYSRTERLIAYRLRIVPVIPDCAAYLGVPCYPSLEELPGEIDIVQIYPGFDVDLVALARTAVTKGAKAFWVEEDEAPREAQKILSKAGVYVVEYESLEREYRKNFVTPNREDVPVKPQVTVRVSGRMTRHPTTVKRTDTVREALTRMRKGHFRHLPVVGENGRLIGMLSDRDLRLVLRSSSIVAREDAFPLESITVEQVAVFDPVVVLHDATLEEAAELMLRWEVGALPVVAGEAFLVGIITYSDLLREFVARGKESSRPQRPLRVAMGN